MKKQQTNRSLWGMLLMLAVVIGIALYLDGFPSVTANTNIDSENTSVPTEATNTLSFIQPILPESETLVVSDQPETRPLEETAATDTPVAKAPAADTPATDECLPESDANDFTASAESRAVLTFLGSCAPGSPLGTTSFGSLNATAQKEGTEYFLKKLQSFLQEDDLTIAANACIFTNTLPAASLTCAAPVSNADIYSFGSVDFVSLSGIKSLSSESMEWQDTQNALTDRGIGFAGDGDVTYFNIQGIRIALICSLLAKNTNTVDDLNAIRNAKNDADIVIVYFWGGESNSHTPEEWLTEALRSFADAGAALIVGCGNGVLRPIEQYGSTTIAYSLGNLIDGASMITENATALLRFTVLRNEDGTCTTSTDFIPCYVNEKQWQPCRMEEIEDEAQAMQFLFGASDEPVQK